MWTKYAYVTQLCPTLCDPMDGSLPDSSVPGILQTRILEWVAIFYSRGSSQPWDQRLISCISHIGRRFLYHCATWKAHTFIIDNFKWFYSVKKYNISSVSD